jgi:hypothetical protein
VSTWNALSRDLTGINQDSHGVKVLITIMKKPTVAAMRPQDSSFRIGSDDGVRQSYHNRHHGYGDPGPAALHGNRGLSMRRPHDRGSRLQRGTVQRAFSHQDLMLLYAREA